MQERIIDNNIGLCYYLIMEIVQIKVCSENCLHKMEEDFSLQEVREIVESDTCPICGRKFKKGFSVEIFAEELNHVETISCCSLECVQNYMMDFGGDSVKIILPANDLEGECVVCRHALPTVSFKLVVSEPQ